MNKIRVYELATQLGVGVKAVTDRCFELGVQVDGHLTQLSTTEVAVIRRAFEQKPAGEVTQKRVKKTVIRRRRRADRGNPAPSPESPTPAVEEEPAAAPEVVASERPAATNAAAGEVASEPKAESESDQAPEQDASVEGVAAVKVEPGDTAGEAVSATEDQAPTTESNEASAAAEEAKARTDTQYGDQSAVNSPGRQVEDEPKRLAQVVGQIDPSLKASLIDQVQRKAERAARPRGGGYPGRPATGPGPAMPPSGALVDPNRADPRKKGKKRAGGRVAYDRNKDRHLDQSGRRRPKRTKRRAGSGMQTERTVPKASKRVIKMEDTITVGQLADLEPDLNG